MYKYFIALLLIIFNVIVGAGNTTGTVGYLYVHGYNDKILFKMKSSSPNFVSCASTKRYATYTNSQEGRNLLSAVLAAKAAGQTIIVYGNNSCSVHPDAEDIRYIMIK